ncbi:MAG: GTPase HflX [Peptostreptococcus sp.]|uniref:GTPase HflX n=1 Tax=Peptostreptococcus sp. TaxID=1262 RepID=UPI002FC67300
MERLIISNKNVNSFDEVAVTIAVAEGEKIHATSVEDSMIELKELVQAAGAEVKAEITLHQKIDKDYYLDKEALDYLMVEIENLDVNMLVFIDELTGSQIKNLEDLTGKKIVDRTMLLLDILSTRSNRRETKLEIEKAQLRYRLTRLEGFQGIYKYGNGICVNNPNGRRLLTDEEKIREKLDSLEVELAITVKNRFVQRSKKVGNELPLVAFIGYTNSGKSSIMNKLLELDPDHTEESAVIVKDKMLSTLDMSLRKSTLPNGKEYLLVDTVGFVSDLPGIMRAAFRSTFEELSYADLILTVYDASSYDLDIQKNIMNYTMQRIGITKKKNVSVLNKVDRIENIPESSDEKIYVSAKSGYNFDRLINVIEQNLFESEEEVTLLIPYSRFDVFNEIKEKRVIEIEDFVLNDIGVELNIVLNNGEFEKYRDFIK